MPDDKEMPKQDNDLDRRDKSTTPDDSYTYEETTTRIRKSQDPSNDTDSWPTKQQSPEE